MKNIPICNSPGIPVSMQTIRPRETAAFSLRGHSLRYFVITDPFAILQCVFVGRGATPISITGCRPPVGREALYSAKQWAWKYICWRGVTQFHCGAWREIKWDKRLCSDCKWLRWPLGACSGRGVPTCNCLRLCYTQWMVDHNGYR